MGSARQITIRLVVPCLVLGQSLISLVPTLAAAQSQGAACQVGDVAVRVVVQGIRGAVSGELSQTLCGRREESVFDVSVRAMQALRVNFEVEGRGENAYLKWVGEPLRESEYYGSGSDPRGWCVWVACKVPRRGSTDLGAGQMRLSELPSSGTPTRIDWYFGKLLDTSCDPVRRPSC